MKYKMKATNKYEIYEHHGYCVSPQSLFIKLSKVFMACVYG